MGRPKKTRESSQEILPEPQPTRRLAPAPTISVIERRLQGAAADVFRTSSRPIPLKEPDRWEVRWTNTDISPDHLYNRLHHGGWVYATVEMLTVHPDELGAMVQGDRIVKGVRGAEVLVVMEKADYRRLVDKKAEINIRDTFGKKKIKEAMVAQTAVAHGPEAAEFIAKSVTDMRITDRRGHEADDLSLDES